MNQPNVLFIFSDQHNARCLSCADHPEVKTPNLDRLAAEGVRFNNAYTQNPICTPSRISFLSSLYPSTHGYYGLYGHAPSQPMTSLFTVFKENGYRTGCLGKLHTPRYWIEKDCQFVYDEFIEYPKYLEGAGLYEKNDSREFTGERSGNPSLIPLEHSCEMALAKQARRFIGNEGEPKDRGDDNAPWCAWVCFSRPHQPWTPSEPFASMYPPETLTLPPVNEQEIVKLRKNYTEEQCRQHLSMYLALTSQVDHAVGEIIRELEKRGELDNTVIIYTTDHGDYAGEHGRTEKGGGISYRAICRIPLIIRFPEKVKQGLAADQVVEAVDVLPTLCDLTGIEIPDTAQGKSFLSVLEGDQGEFRKDALTENPWRKSLATKKWRYVANLPEHGEKDELYSLEDDPWELNNRIDDPECAEIAAELSRRLFDRVVKANRPVNVINGGWHNHVYDRDGRLDPKRCGEVNSYW